MAGLPIKIQPLTHKHLAYHQTYQRWLEYMQHKGLYASLNSRKGTTRLFNDMILLSLENRRENTSILSDRKDWREPYRIPTFFYNSWVP